LVIHGSGAAMSGESELNYTMPLGVYLQAAIVRGVLVTNQDRLSNFLLLRQDKEVFSLKDASLESLNGTEIVNPPDEYVVYMREVYMIADLSPIGRTRGSDAENFYVKKDTSKALISVGPYLIQGNIYLIPGSELHDLLLEKSPFIPVTDAIILGRSTVSPQTYLINRSKIGFMTAISDSLGEL
jgi:hypothetical protein